MEHGYQDTSTHGSEIDPRLQQAQNTSQPYPEASIVGGTQGHFRPPPDPPFQRQQHQHQQHLHHQQSQGEYGGLPQPWPQDGLPFYAPPAQYQPSASRVQQTPTHSFQPYHDPRNPQMQLPLPTSPTEATDFKRSRACEACRNLKVKCEPDPEGGRCKRCAKAGRSCVISAPSRKRQKKTDSRVEDLEKRIDDLQQQMRSVREGDGSETDKGLGWEEDLARTRLLHGEPIRPSIHDSPSQNNFRKRPFAELEQDGSSAAGPSSEHVLGTPAFAPDSGGPPLPESISLREEGPSAIGINHGRMDIVDRGLLTATVAKELFLRYTRLMAPQMPIVVFSSETTCEDVRQSTPILFLAIMSVASGEDYQDLQITLNKEIMHTLAGRIIVSGEKSLELAQALQVVTIWYWREANGDSKYYQFVHLASIMAIDLRLNKKAESKRQSVLALQQPKSFISDTESVECRRAWLGCYLLSSSIAMGMRRPTLLRHDDNSTYFEDCIEKLQELDDATGNNRTLCDLVRLQIFADVLADQILPEESAIMSEAKVRSVHNEYEKQTKIWRDQESRDEKPLCVSLAYNINGLYMYELAMQHLSYPEPPKTSRTRGKLNPAQTPPESNTALTFVLGILDTFVSLSVQDVRTLPTFYFAQIAHAGVSLIKMYFVAKADSDYYKIVPITAALVEERLESLLQALRSAAADGKSLAAHTFLKVIGALQELFQGNRHTSMEYIKTRFSGAPSLKDTQILDLEEPQPTPQQRTASRRIVEKGGDGLDLLHLASAAAMEQSKTSELTPGNDSRSDHAADDGAVAAMGQLIGEGDVGFMGDEGLLGIMQSLFLKGARR